MKFGKVIKKAREAANMTQEQLGAKIGVTGVSIMRYEKNQRQPRFEQLPGLADALNIDLAHLFISAVTSTVDSDGALFLDEAIREKYNIKGEYRIVDIESVGGDDNINRIFSAIFELNADGFQKASEYIEDLAGNPKYRRTEPPTSEETSDTDTDITAKEKPPEGNTQPNDGE